MPWTLLLPFTPFPVNIQSNTCCLKYAGVGFFCCICLGMGGRRIHVESLESAYPQDCLKGNLRSVGCCWVMNGRFLALGGCLIKWCESQNPVGSVVFLVISLTCKIFYTALFLRTAQSNSRPMNDVCFVCVFLIYVLLILIDCLFLFTGFVALPRFPQCGFRISTPSLRSISLESCLI